MGTCAMRGYWFVEYSVHGTISRSPSCTKAGNREQGTRVKDRETDTLRFFLPDPIEMI
jgi:hypothetical protein